MCILVWGLLPRVVLMVVLHQRTRRACRQMLLSHPQVRALLERLQSSRLAVSASANADGEGRSLIQSERGVFQTSDTGQMTLIWNDCLTATTSGDLSPSKFTGQRVNVQQTDAQWEALAGSLDVTKSGTLELLVAGWEPPSLSLRDFLLVLNRDARHSVEVRIVPINVAGTGVDAFDQRVWVSTLAGWALDNVTVADRWSRP